MVLRCSRNHVFCEQTKRDTLNIGWEVSTSRISTRNTSKFRVEVMKGLRIVESDMGNLILYS